jgi:hypothetical protein
MRPVSSRRSLNATRTARSFVPELRLFRIRVNKSLKHGAAGRRDRFRRRRFVGGAVPTIGSVALTLWAERSPRTSHEADRVRAHLSPPHVTVT